MRAMIKEKSNARIVSFKFGEGANPLFRKHREALMEVGLNPDIIMKHNNPRHFYLIPLVNNLDDVLLGLNKNIEYFISLENTKQKTNLIYEYWTKRWLLPRLSKDLLEKLSNHTLVYPIEHGAQVSFPSDMEDNQSEFEFHD